MKQLYELPDHVDKPCGSVPGPDDTQYVASLSSMEACDNPASYVVTVDDQELLVCGTHRKTVQESDQELFEEVINQ